MADEYLILKREVCPNHKGLPQEYVTLCCWGTGYIETQVDANEWLLDVLKKLRFLVSDYDVETATQRLNFLRIEDDE